MFYIYKVTNTINNKVYIGFTSCDPEKRWQEHVYASKYTDCKFYRAIRKYGIDKFTMRETYSGEDRGIVLNMEQYFVKENNSFLNGYNSTEGGSSYEFTPEVKAKISKSVKAYFESLNKDKKRQTAAKRRSQWRIHHKNKPMVITSDLPGYCLANNIPYGRISGTKFSRQDMFYAEKVDWPIQFNSFEDAARARKEKMSINKENWVVYFKGELQEVLNLKKFCAENSINYASLIRNKHLKKLNIACTKISEVA